MYVEVQNAGSMDQLQQLLSKGRITQEMFDDAKKQIENHDARYKVEQDEYAKKFAKFKDDLHAWRLANGYTAPDLKGMTGAAEYNNSQAISHFNANYKAGALAGSLPSTHYLPDGTVVNPRSAVKSQKDSNVSHILRKTLKQKSVEDPSSIDQYGSDAKTIKGLDAACDMSPPLKEDTMFIRTFDTGAFFNHMSGKQFTAADNITNIKGTIQRDWGFSEMSPGSLAAGASPGLKMGNVVMELRVPAGTKGVWTGSGGFGHAGERGWIAQRGIVYYIHSVEKKPTKTGAGTFEWHVKAEVIPTEYYEEYDFFTNDNPFFE